MSAPASVRVRALDVKPGHVMQANPHIAQRGGLVTYVEHRAGEVLIVLLDCPGFVLENATVTEVDLRRAPDDVVHLHTASVTR